MKYQFLTLAILGLISAGFATDANALNLKNITSTATKVVSSNPFKAITSTSSLGSSRELTNIATQAISSTIKSSSGTSNLTNYSTGISAALASAGVGSTAGSSASSSTGSSGAASSLMTLSKYGETVKVQGAPESILAGPSGGSGGGLGGLLGGSVNIGGITLSGGLGGNGLTGSVSGLGQTASLGSGGLTSSLGNLNAGSAISGISGAAGLGGYTETINPITREITMTQNTSGSSSSGSSSNPFVANQASIGSAITRETQIANTLGNSR